MGASDLSKQPLEAKAITGVIEELERQAAARPEKLTVRRAGDRIEVHGEIDVDAVVTEIKKRGIDASGLENVSQIVEQLADRARANDVILVMSNGAFGGLIPMLLTALETRASG